METWSQANQASQIRIKTKYTGSGNVDQGSCYCFSATLRKILDSSESLDRAWSLFHFEFLASSFKWQSEVLRNYRIK